MYDDARTSAGHAKSVNFAPVEPLQKLKQDPSQAASSSTFTQIVKEWHDEIWGRHVDEREEIAEGGRRMAAVRSGKLLVKRDPLYGGIALVKPLPTRARTDLHVYPLAQTNSSQLTSMFTLSRPRVLPRYFGNTNTAQIQHALLEQVAGYYQTTCLNELVHQDWSLDMMDYGTALFRPYYDQRLNTLVSLLPVVQDVNQTIFEGYQGCKDCPMEGSPEQFQLRGEVMPRCPDCGSYNVTEGLDPISVDAAQVVGQEEFYQGDIGIEKLEVPAAVWDMRYMAHDSQYFGYLSEPPIRLVRSILGVDVQENSPEDDVGLSVLHALGTRGGATENYGRENLWGNIGRFPHRTAHMYEDYYDPSWYAGVKLKKEETAIGGTSIPADVPLEKVFPDGMCVVSFDKGSIVVGAFNEKRRVIGSVYHLQSGSGVGKGTTDAVEIYEQLNDAHSANLAVIKRYGAGGGWGYDKDAITRAEAKELLKPGGLVGVSMRNTRYTSIDQAFGEVKPKEVNNSNLTMVAQLANLMNIAFQTTEFTSGVINDNIDINTARGQEMLAAQNQQRSAAPLRMKGYATARLMEEVVDLFRVCMKAPRYIATGDKFALSNGRYIKGEDIPEKVFFDFVTDSEIPLNRHTKSLNAQNMLEKSQYWGVPFYELAKAQPEWAMWWAELHQADIPLFNRQEILVVCQNRINKLKELVQAGESEAQLTGVPVDPAALVEQLKVYPYEENHQLKGQILSRYLDDDEVATWPDTMVAAVHMLITKHFEFDSQLQGQLMIAAASNQGTAQGEMMGQAAMRQAQITAPLMQAQAQAQAQAEQAASEQQLANEGYMKAADLAAEEEALSRDQEAADKDAQRQDMLAGREFVRERAAAAEDHKRELEIKKYERATANSGASSRPKRKR